jgi:glucokinase
VEQDLAVGIDIGGTKVAAGVVDRDGAVLAFVRRPTPTHDPVATEDTIAAVVAELAAEHEVRAVGIGAAGFVDADRSAVLFSPHLAWRREPLRAAVAARVGLPVVVENDANAAAWAEWRFGAGIGESFLVCVNLGTGIGGAVIVNGQLLRGRFGMAGEFGHMVVVPDGHPCECGKRGCWEQYVSGNTLVRDARELAQADPKRAEGILGRVDGDPDAIVGTVVAAAAAAGDPAAISLFETMGRGLGLGLANLAAAFDPGLFVIGGGVADVGDIMLGPARESFQSALTGRGYRPEAAIVAATLHNDAGFIGAADLARRGTPVPRGEPADVTRSDAACQPRGLRVG